MLTLFLSSFLTGCGGEAPKQNTFDNLPPFSPIISMTPTDPVTTDDLVVGIITESSDPDGDEVTTGYVWTVDGVISDETSETVPASATTKGEVWTVNVISNDGTLDSAPATFSVTIKNTAPVIDSYTATEDAVFGDALSVVVDSTSDADNDTVELAYSWTVNGESSAYDTGEIPADVTQVNEVWVLTITPNDGDTDGEEVVLTYDFTNAVPVINSVTIDPAPAFTTDELSVVVDVTDAEDDAIEGYAYEWFINGESAGMDATLAAGTAVRGDVVSVSVIASDMYGDSAAVSSADVTIENSEPFADTTVGPMAAVYGEDVVCGLTNEADSDLSDTVTISEVLWTFGSGATTTTTDASLALTVADHGTETSVSCTPTFTDGIAFVSGASSDSVTISDLALRHLVAGDLVITEIMQNPSAVNDSDGEWFEVWVNSTVDTTAIGGGNRGDINLKGLMIADLDNDDTMIEMDFNVEANEYIVFGLNDDITTNGGVEVDYLYSGINLSNSDDELLLKNESDVTIDEVIWDDGNTFPDPAGASMSLDTAFQDAISNDDGNNWCEGDSAYGDGDLGTPGAENYCE